MTRFSRSAWWIVFLASLAGCSGGAGGSGSDDGAALPTHLDGLYEASSTGDLQWISFFGDDDFALERVGDDCGDGVGSPDCFGAGTYTIDTVARTIALADSESGETLSFPLGVVESGAVAGGGSSVVGKTEPLDEPLVNGGSSGGVVMSNGSPLTTPSSLSLAQSGGSQKLVNSSSALVSDCSMQPPPPSDCSSSPPSTSSSSPMALRLHEGAPVAQWVPSKTCQAILMVCHLIAMQPSVGAGGSIVDPGGEKLEIVTPLAGKKK